MEFKAILEAVGKRLSQKPQEFISSLYKDDAQTELISESEIIKKLENLISERITANNEDQYNRGFKKRSKDFETAIRNQGFSSDLKGVELLEAYIESIKPDPDAKPKKEDLTKEALAKMPLVKELIAEGQKAVNEKLQTTESEFNKYKNQAEEVKLRAYVSSKGIGILKKNNVILEVEGVGSLSKEEAAQKRAQNLFNSLDYSRMKIGENDEIIMLDPDGDPLKDKFGKDVSFESHLMEINTYPIRKQDPTKKAPERKVPSDDDPSKRQQKFDITIENEAQYNELILKETNAAKRIAIMEAWDAKQNSET